MPVRRLRAKCGYALQPHIIGSGPKLARSMAAAFLVLYIFDVSRKTMLITPACKPVALSARWKDHLRLMRSQFWKRFSNGMRTCFHHISLPLRRVPDLPAHLRSYATDVRSFLLRNGHQERDHAGV